MQLYLSRQQLSCVLSGTENTTMYRDGTTKKGKHYAGVQIATEDKVYTVGMRQMASGSAQNYFDSVMTMLDDIQDAAEKIDVTNNILKNISCAMTDRHVVEKKENSMWVQAKKDTQPDDSMVCIPFYNFLTLQSVKLKNLRRTNVPRRDFCIGVSREPPAPFVKHPKCFLKMV